MSQEIQPTVHTPYTRMTGEIYDLIYSEKDYKDEAKKISDIVSNKCKSGGNALLDVACGTGAHMKYFIKEFEVDGLDLSPEQVEAAKKKFPNNNIVLGDMVDFDMGKTYDVVVCLFSSIGYLQTVEKLNQAIFTMAKHLKPGGVLLVEPWLKAENLIEDNISVDAKSQPSNSFDYKLGQVSINSGKKKRLHVVRVGTISRNGIVTSSEMHHMVARDGGKVSHFIELHKLAMFSDEDFSNAFKKSGLTIEIDPIGLTNRRLCVGVMPLD